MNKQDYLKKIKEKKSALIYCIKNCANISQDDQKLKYTWTKGKIYEIKSMMDDRFSLSSDNESDILLEVNDNLKGMFEFFEFFDGARDKIIDEFLKK